MLWVPLKMDTSLLRRSQQKPYNFKEERNEPARVLVEFVAYKQNSNESGALLFQVFVAYQVTTQRISYCTE